VRAHSLLLFTLFMGLVIALLVGLGLWQLERRAWKEALIAKVEARVKAEPVGLDEAIIMARGGEDVSYLRVRVEGRFAHDQERYLYALSGNEPGWHVITPLMTAGGKAVLVDRGFVPKALMGPTSRRAGQVEGLVSVAGLARPPEQQGLFVPDNAPDENRCLPQPVPTSRPSLLTPKQARSLADGRGVGRPASHFPTITCNMRSPGFCWRAASSPFTSFICAGACVAGLGADMLRGKAPAARVLFASSQSEARFALSQYPGRGAVSVL
jgi:hypothetical protein